MFEQDYIMRLIKEMVRALLKLIFNVDTETPAEEMLEDENQQEDFNDLIDMVDRGLINEAENRVYEMTESGEKADLEVALLFYSYLNDKSEEFLLENNFSREEIKLGLKDLLARYGVAGFAETFLQ